jgi:hypothetical protein
MSASISKLQALVVRSVANDITDLHDGAWGDRDWLRIGVNLELRDAGAETSTQALVIARHPSCPLETLSFRLGLETVQLFADLAAAMQQPGKPQWTIANLEIDRDGHYSFDFGYGPPPRLSGNLAHQPLKGFLQRYREETGSD